MTSTAQELRRSGRVAASAPVLGRAVEALAAKREADVELLMAAVEWAEANPAGPGVGSGVDPAEWGDSCELFGEGFLALAGEGAPLLSEFAPLELGAALGWTSAGAQLLMGDALEFKHRLPRLWALVVELRSLAPARPAPPAALRWPARRSRRIRPADARMGEPVNRPAALQVLMNSLLLRVMPGA